jgi:hypothetical protein
MSGIVSGYIQPKFLGSLAAASVAGLASQADGAVQYTPANIPINVLTPTGTINFTSPISGELSINYGIDGITLNKGTANKADYAANSLTLDPRALAAGESVQTAINFDSEKLKVDKSGILINPEGISTGEFTAAAGERFIGVIFEIGQPVPVSYFGWIGFQTLNDSSNANLSGVITGWAYEDSGGDILTGSTTSIPEPSSLALLAMGAAGLAAYRKRRMG